MSRISNLFFNKAWAVHPDLIDPMTEIVKRHVEGAKLADADILTRISAAQNARPGREKYEISSVSNGTAVIGVYGVIGKRMSQLDRISMDGVDVLDIQKDLQAAIDDKDVERIVLDIDSPGGSADGVAELSEFIFSARGKKPILAVANGMMCSAAYWIGSAADKIHTTQGSAVGSIGVYTVIRDFTVREHNAGVKSLVIKAGEYKAAGHPSKHMSAGDIGAIQSEVDTIYDLFVDAVAKNRGISRAKALDIANGKVWIGRQAVDMGLADAVSAVEAVVGGGARPGMKAQNPIDIDAKSGKQNDTKHQGEDDMDLKILTRDQLKAENAGLVKQIEDDAIAAQADQHGKSVSEAVSAAKAEGHEAGVKAERERISGISAFLSIKELSAYTAVAQKAIEDGVSVAAAEIRIKDARMADLEAKASAPVTPGDGNDAGVSGKTSPKQTPYEAHAERAKAYQKEHGGSMTDALKKTTNG